MTPPYLHMRVPNSIGYGTVDQLWYILSVMACLIGYDTGDQVNIATVRTLMQDKNCFIIHHPKKWDAAI
jgi:hypothetical protein